MIGGKSKVLVCSIEAGKKYVRAGMRLSEAKAVCAELIWRQYEERLYIVAQKEMLAYLVSCSPRVSSHEIGAFLMDASGLTHMGGEGNFCRNLLRIASLRGYIDCNVGIADSAFAATVAAKNKKRRWHIVPSGEDSKFLSHLAVDYLPISLELKDTLFALGIERMGQFTDLAIDEVERRFGNEGLQAYKLARGIDSRQPSLPLVEKSFQCFVDIGGPIESLNDTLFVIKSMLERLTKLLKEEELSAEELFVSFWSDTEVFEERPIRLLRPTNNSKFLLEVLRLSLENNKLAREFTGVHLAVSKSTKESAKQLDLSPPEKNNERSHISSTEALEDESFLLLMERLNARYAGKNTLLRPIAADQYKLEDAGTWQPAIAADLKSNAVCINEESVNYIKQYLGDSGLVSGLVLKRGKSMPVLMQFHQSRPDAFTCQAERYKIHSITLPECLSGSWWDAPLRKSYYRALAQPAGLDEFILVLLAYDHERRAWFLEGVYD